jgi:hypothetical protein
MIAKRYRLVIKKRKHLEIHTTTYNLNHLDEAMDKFYEAGFCLAFIKDVRINKLLLAKTKDGIYLNRLER